MEDWENLVARNSRCLECGAAFQITLGEFISKLDSGMSLPRRCKACRRERRKHPDQYAGLYGSFSSYPSTKGHRHKVHGGV